MLCMSTACSLLTVLYIIYILRSKAVVSVSVQHLLISVLPICSAQFKGIKGYTAMWNVGG